MMEKESEEILARLSADASRVMYTDGSTVPVPVARTAGALTAAGYGGRHLVAVDGASHGGLLGAVLGCLAARVPVLPMDGSLPRPWRARIAQQARAALWLTDLPAEGPPLPFPPPREGGSQSSVDIDDVAYVLPTSGTTGAPKLPAIGRIALARHVRAVVDAFGLRSDDVVLQTASPGFDVWLEETLPTLFAGASLVLCPAGLRQSFADLERCVRDRGVTVLNLPTGYWSGWWEHLVRSGRRPPESLRLVVVGSERVPAGPFRDWLERWPDGPRLVSGYGLTETTVTALLYDPMRQPLPRAAAAVPLGQPLAGTRVRLEPTADADTFELLLGGDRLMRGYLGDADATATAFHDVERRWLRTGDLVRPVDGALYPAGRLDSQVKVNGVRVNLDDVEGHMTALPGVAEAAVAHDPNEGLVALVRAANADLTAHAVRAMLAQRLPVAFVPGSVALVDALPRRGSGKVDRAAVRQRFGELARNSTAPPEPPARGGRPLREWLADLMGWLLRRPMRPDEAFFALGGNSLLAVRLIARLAEAGYTVALSEVFSDSTPVALARRLERPRAPNAVDPSRTAPIGRRGHTHAPLTLQQLGVWLHGQFYPDSLAYNAQSVFELTGPLDPDAVADAIARLAQRHAVMRMAVRVDDDVPSQVVLDSPAPRLEVIDLRSVPAAERTPMAGRAHQAILAHRFDLSAAPLARWTLIRHDDQRSGLYLVEHHLVHDGVSFALLAQDLVALLGGRTPEERPSAEYLDYAHWQRDRVAEGAYRAAIAEWRHRLANVPDLRALSARAAGSTDRRAGVLINWIPEESANAYRRAAGALGVTLFTFLLGCYRTALSEHFGQADFAVGVSVANRAHPQTAGTVGMFVNTVAVVGGTGSDPLEATQALGEELAWALDRQDVPFSLVVSACRPRRHLSSTPLYQVTFNFDDAPVPAVVAGEVVGEVVELQSGYAKVDLSLVAVPQAEQRMLHGTGGGVQQIKLIWQYRRAVLSDVDVADLTRRFVAAADRATRVLGIGPRARDQKPKGVLDDTQR
jgi:non-ribosomal peptide synthetase component F